MTTLGIGRNDPCPCGSGRRYKQCHGGLAPQPAGFQPTGSAPPANAMTNAREALARGDLATAMSVSDRLLATMPDDPDVLELGASLDLERGDAAAAAGKLERAIGLEPTRPVLHRRLARARLALGSAAAAGAAASAAIERDATDWDAWTVLGLAHERDDPVEALKAWTRATEIAPDEPEPHFRRGDLHRRRGEIDSAIAAYGAARSKGLEHPVLLNNFGLALAAAGLVEDAERCYRSALSRQPKFVEALVNLGDLLAGSSRHDEAVTAYSQAVAIQPGIAQLWSNLGSAQHRSGLTAAARESFERALALDPQAPKALIDMAAMLVAEQDYVPARALVERALGLRPDYGEAQDMLLYVDQQTCRWIDFEQRIGRQRDRLADEACAAVAPHNLLALPYSAAELLAGTRKFVRQRIRTQAVTPPVAEAVDGRLRIGYVSTDFRRHPLANLLTEVIETHDRSRFEVYGYSLGPDDASPERARFARGFDHFLDVRMQATPGIAARIRADRIAVLLDTNGYVIHARNELFALRPAAIQINAIGFPGTLGATHYDYILTDAFTTPPGEQANFDERFMLLPHCYLPGDTRRPIAAAPARRDCGLSDEAFVFCCFNTAYKILPALFDVWMRMLRSVRGSVLWLLEGHRTAMDNLRHEAASRGVAAHRLVFAPRAPLAEHLARHACADLFLDTFPCNAHTTANDALFAGLPLLTCAGETFASRVSGSHLHAIALPELVTHDLAAYEALGLELARDPARLRDIRRRLQENRATRPLFQVRTYTRALESLFLDAMRARGSIH